MSARYALLALFGVLLVLAQAWMAGLGHGVGHTMGALGVTPLAAWSDMGGFSPSLTVPFVMLLGVADGKTAECAIVTFVTGYFLDLASGAPVGLFTFAHVAVFAVSRSFGVRVVTQTTLALTMLTAVVSLLHSGVVLGLLAIFGRDAWVPRTLVRFILPRAVATTMTAPFVLIAARRVHALVLPRSARPTERASLTPRTGGET